MMDIEDYITAELGQEPMPEFEEVDAGTLEIAVPKVEALPAIVDRYPVVVGDKKYSASKDRLYLLSTKGDNTYESFVSSLIVVVAETRDNSSSNWGKVVCFIDPAGVKKQMYLRNSEIATNGNAIVKAMVDEGLQISTDNRMIDALLHYLNLAPPMEKKMAICTDRIGWHGNVYLFHDNSFIGNEETRIVYTGAPLGKHHATKGTLEEWKDNVASLCKGNSMLIFAICVSFASVLLRLLKAESGGYHIYGESSTGKSTTLYVGASVHGDPEHLMGTWRTTTNGAEGKAKKSNDSLMINDELHQSNPKEAGDAVYMLMNGKGKQRATVIGDAREVTEWRLNCLSSGEVSSAAFIKEGGKSVRAGHVVRMLDISADMGLGMGIFENIHDAPSSHIFAERLKKASSEYYGTPVRAFLQKLVSDSFSDGLEKCFAERKECFFADFVPAGSDAQVQRVATKLVIVAMAGEIATDIGITGWEAGEAYKSVSSCFTKWLSNQGTSGQYEAVQAEDQVKSFLLHHGLSRFIPVTKDLKGHYEMEFPDRQYINMAGYRHINKQGKIEFIVFPDTFRNEMCSGLNFQYVSKTLVEREFLMVCNDGKAQVSRRMPNLPQSRYYHFKPSIFEETDEFEATDPEAEIEEQQ